MRRRKADVEGELPERTINTYFVPMTPEQRKRHEDYESRSNRLISIAERRPLNREEFEHLQQLLACMRMVCDTPYILDEECRDFPKLEELRAILEDLLSEPETKVIIFSEWVRVLDRIAEWADADGIE